MQNANMRAEASQEKAAESYRQMKEAENDKIMAQQIAKTFEEQVKSMTNMLKEQKDDFEKQLAEIYDRLRTKEERDSMINEDYLANFFVLQEQHKAVCNHVKELLLVKARKEELDHAMAANKETIEQYAINMRNKDLMINTLRQQLQDTKYTLEQQIKKMQKDNNLQVNELEQKITYDSIQTSQMKKKLMEEAQTLRKDLTETKYQMRQLQSKRGGFGRNKDSDHSRSRA